VLAAIILAIVGKILVLALIGAIAVIAVVIWAIKKILRADPDHFSAW